MLVADWISVNERLPHEGDEVLVCVVERNGQCRVTTHILNGVWWFDTQAWQKVTHWAQMPKPPNGNPSE